MPRLHRVFGDNTLLDTLNTDLQGATALTTAPPVNGPDPLCPIVRQYLQQYEAGTGGPSVLAGGATGAITRALNCAWPNWQLDLLLGAAVFVGGGILLWPKTPTRIKVRRYGRRAIH